MGKSVIDDAKLKDQIRAAYRSGKKRMLVEGCMMSIEKTTKQVHFYAGGEQRTRKESWLVLKPIDGTMLPRIQIEVKDGENIRSRY